MPGIVASGRPERSLLYAILAISFTASRSEFHEIAHDREDPLPALM